MSKNMMRMKMDVFALIDDLPGLPLQVVDMMKCIARRHLHQLDQTLGEIELLYRRVKAGDDTVGLPYIFGQSQGTGVRND